MRLIMTPNRLLCFRTHTTVLLLLCAWPNLHAQQEPFTKAVTERWKKYEEFSRKLQVTIRHTAIGLVSGKT